MPIRVLAVLCRCAIVISVVFAVLGGAPAQAQSVPFQLRVQQGTNVFVVANGSNVTLSANAVGKATTINLTAIYTGTSTVSVAMPILLGNTDFTLVTSDKYPLKLNPGDSFSVSVNYNPSSTGGAAAQLNIPVAENTTVPGIGATTNNGTITLNLIGTVPNLVVSYFLSSNGNVIPVPAGGTITFPPTLVKSTAQATVIISNRGSGTGVVNSLSVSGKNFQPLGLPLTPFNITPGADVRIGINYTPTQVGTDTGTFQADLGGIPFTATLSGSGIQPGFSYQMLTATDTVPFAPNQTVTVPDTNVGDTSKVTIRVQNTGTAAGVINSLGTTAGPFSISDAPLLPVMLNPDDVMTFTLAYAPTQAGPSTGKLQVGNDLFTLNGTGLGPSLAYAYTSGSTTTVTPNGVVVFSPVQVGASQTVPFTVTNSGTKPATIASVAVSDTHGIFKIQDPPAFPVNLDPGDSLTFNVAFAPNTTGLATANLLVNSASFTLDGSGTPPPPLPGVQFTGASGNVEPQSQPAVGLTLAGPYPLPLNGTLSLAVTSAAFTPDPAIQFSTGTRVVPFTIPANSTQAQFANGANQIRLQTGSTAGTITLTAALSTPSGLDVTPPTPPALTLTVPPSTPHLISIVQRTSTTNGFILNVTGFSTTRSLSKLNFQFRVSSDVTAPSSLVTLDVSAAATNWYSSTAAQQFGGQFSITVPFTLTGTGALATPTTTSSSSSTPPSTLISKIQSVSVTATNDQGTSNAVSTPIQ